jgi:predicted lipid-binding transport protein (Tim44 family)
VASRDGETRIQAEERLQSYAGALYGGVVGGGGMGIGMGVGFGVGLGALGSALFALAFPVTLTGVLYVAMRQVMKSIGRKRRADADALVDRIARYVKAPPQ